MQTFLPYADFIKSAACLDNKRLNKQIVECKQILMVLRGKTKAWEHHPVVLMWKGYEGGLSVYGLSMCFEYATRSHKPHNCYGFTADVWLISEVVSYPPWLGYEPFHSMHRAVLLDKDPTWYGQFGWTEQPAKKVKNGIRMSYPYLWPSKMEQFKTKEN